MRTILTTLFIICTCMMLHAVDTDTTFVEIPIILGTATGDLHGTVMVPDGSTKVPVALIISGSGPTDRDGNNPMMKNNSLKMLATELAKEGIATVRYDKRGVGESQSVATQEADLRFDDYVRDAMNWIQLLKQDKRFSQITIIGHSEGSLIGMLASSGADKFVSIAGAGQSADLILKRQLESQPAAVKDMCFPVIDSLRAGKTIDVNPMLYSLFRPSVQPYMISWFNYDPGEEIKKLPIPVLILQGTNDLQVMVDDAKSLAANNKNANLILIENMNHVLKITDTDPQANASSYNNPELPVAPELIEAIADFILKN